MALPSLCNAVLEVLLPRICPVCEGKLLENEDTICSDCLAAICRTEHADLPDNGVDMVFAEWRKEDKHVIHYERGAAWGYYNRDREQVLRRLIEVGKYGSAARPDVFYALGQHAAAEYMSSALIDDIDVLVPIPLSSKRLRERGFNQAEAICQGLSSVWHIPVDTTHLKRTKDNPHQAHIQLEERFANVERIFHVDYPEEWKNRHILLVDDVVTSGSTLYSAMREMTPIRGSRISVFCLGWAHA